ncbi:hypothetical protein PR048_017893 [Dryococelus australis]|uniref:Transposase n=1 Tax=Dryococelus australis TaxID=614101 RepID=A0ABQ9HAQ9_9NEOP|nr:hypothetical protein PR048_017893 [Dryococelus australis]
MASARRRSYSWLGYQGYSREPLLFWSSAHPLPTLITAGTSVPCSSRSILSPGSLAPFVTACGFKSVWATAEIRWKRMDDGKPIVIRLDIFRTMIVVLFILHKRSRYANLKELCVESNMIAEGSDRWTARRFSRIASMREAMCILYREVVSVHSTSVDLCCTVFGIGPLVFVRGSMNTEAYCNILYNEMLPTLWCSYGMDPCYFQDARCHVSRATMQWYADNNVRRLDWPTQIPDLNPIEYLWDELDRRVRARQARPKSIAQLTEWLQEEWRRILADVLQTFIMPDRVAVVIAARGGTDLSGGLHHLTAEYRLFKPKEQEPQKVKPQIGLGTVVAERLACSPPTNANRVQSPAESLPDFCIAGRCRWSAVFSGISRFIRPFIPALLHTRLNHPISCQDLAVKSRPNLFTHSQIGGLKCLVLRVATWNRGCLSANLEIKEAATEVERNDLLPCPTKEKEAYMFVVTPKEIFREGFIGQDADPCFCIVFYYVNSSIFSTFTPTTFLSSGPGSIRPCHSRLSCVGERGGYCLGKLGFLGGLLLSPPLHSFAAQSPSHYILLVAEDIVSKRLPDLSTHSQQSQFFVLILEALPTTASARSSGRWATALCDQQVQRLTRLDKIVRTWDLLPNPPATPSGTIPTCENPVTRPGIEPGSPWWANRGPFHHKYLLTATNVFRVVPRLPNAQLHHRGSKLDPSSDVRFSQKTIAPSSNIFGWMLKLEVQPTMIEFQTTMVQLDIRRTVVYLEIFPSLRPRSAGEGDTTTLIKCAIAPTRRIPNWRCVLVVLHPKPKPGTSVHPCPLFHRGSETLALRNQACGLGGVQPIPLVPLQGTTGAGCRSPPGLSTRVGISPDLLQHTESTTTSTSPTTMIGHQREPPVGPTDRPVLPLNFHDTSGLSMTNRPAGSKSTEQIHTLPPKWLRMPHRA